MWNATLLMHESGDFAHSPLNLFISARAPRFCWRVWTAAYWFELVQVHPLLVTAFPSSFWLLHMVLYTSEALISSLLFTVLLSVLEFWLFLHFEAFISLEGFYFLFYFIFYHPMVDSYFSPSCLSMYIVLIQRYTTFQEFSATLGKKRKEKKKQPKWIFSKTIEGIFKLFAPVCWWLVWFVCDCKYFHDDAALL